MAAADHTPKAPDCQPVKQAAKTIILDWDAAANPFPNGEHYASAMECALRIPVFLTALKQIDDLSPDEFALIGESFLSALTHEGVGFPSMGDGDDGYAVAPGVRPARGRGTPQK